MVILRERGEGGRDRGRDIRKREGSKERGYGAKESVRREYQERGRDPLDKDPKRERVRKRDLITKEDHGREGNRIIEDLFCFKDLVQNETSEAQIFIPGLAKIFLFLGKEKIFELGP